MSFAPIRVFKRPNCDGIVKIHIQKFFLRYGYRPEHYETVMTFVPEDVPALHAALTKYLAEENANRN